MSGKKSIIKTMFFIIVLGGIFVFIGLALHVKAMAEAKASYFVPSGYYTATAVVESVEVEKDTVTNGGKTMNRTRYITEVTSEYMGNTYSATVMGTPFTKVGDTMEVYINPETGVLTPTNNDIGNVMNLISFIPGVFVMTIGGIIILAAIISAIKKFSVFKEKNKVYGVIVDVYENPNIIIDHKHPKKAICEVTDPVTGAVTRYESANSSMDLFSMVGMNVPIYVNRKKPDKSFVDLENAMGELKLKEGQQRVHDFRNL